ncbi:MAG: tRNA guanosine(15) transglycosylase TgtA [Thermoproteota archaeon]|nr:tRNA guanosine(15) transglycosylase TgtA [Thermoproteota archaeon]
MCFEIRNRDLLGRIGRLETKSGIVETPCLLPVVNPAIQTVSPKNMHERFNCNALMTNAYILKRRFHDETIRRGVHRLLGFDGVVVTDSGAYQNLVYGDVEINPEEIVLYQEEINSDVGTMLDVPTGWKVSKEHVQRTVDETLRRAKQFTNIKTRDDIIWIGPVQGGKYFDLVAECARKMGKLPFQVHALGSPTPVMEQYMFDVLVDMVMTAKMNLPLQRPLHLFGAGHPFMFALAVALGCDSFDSAAYAIYARKDGYMTEYGTAKLNELTYFPCSCPMCVKNDPKDVAEMPKNERQKLLAEHNLYVSFAEVKRIKQAIIEGRLWEQLEVRAHSHPALFRALKMLKKYESYLEKQSPVKKRSGVFFFSSVGLHRPEVVHYRKRLSERYFPPEKAGILVLLPQVETKPFHKSKKHKKFLNFLQQKLEGDVQKVHVCTYAAPFGVIPIELDEVFPLSQHEIATPLDTKTIEYVAKEVAGYIKATNYEKIILVQDSDVWKGKIAATVKHTCEKKGLCYIVING